MARRQLTEAQKTERRARLRKARETRAAKKATQPPVPLDEESTRFAVDVAEHVIRSSVTRDDEAMAARRARLLGDLDPETAALFSDEELEKIEREEAAKAAEEKKKQALADVRATARQRARVEQDLIHPSVLRTADEQKRLAEPVTFRVRLPSDGAGHHGRNGIRVDGRLYQDGRTYTEPRVVVETLQEIHYRAHLNEVKFKTLDQQKPGGSAVEVLAHHIPEFVVNG